MLKIFEFEIDEDNEAEFAAHGVSALELEQVLSGRYRIFRNKRNRSGDLLLIGVTYGGRVLSVPIAKTAIDGRWRPVTAWDATKAEKERYEA